MLVIIFDANPTQDHSVVVISQHVLIGVYTLEMLAY